MRVHACQQGSREWLELRAGIPTASEFKRIVTAGGKASKSFDGYLNDLLAERILRRPRVTAVSMWMQRGTELEAEAVAFYEFERDAKTEPIGFVTNDEGTIGASPDRLISGDPDGLLEIKVPSEGTHVEYLRSAAGASEEYKVQTQGQLWIAGRRYVDILSYHPEMPPALFRVERDEAFIEALSDAVMKFSRILENITLEFIERGWIKPKVEKTASASNITEFIGDEDLEWARTRNIPAAAEA